MSSVKDLAEHFNSKAIKEELEALRKENEELKKAVARFASLNETVTPEELICIEQIRILQNRSNQRELSLEEVKKLDYLIKNLRLIKERSTQNLSVPFRDVTEADLVAIATQSESDS